jgi:MOSC domain-containing protein YiiM
VLSVNVGAPQPTTAPGPGTTGIAKQPVEAIEVRAPGPKRGGLGSGVVGDFIGDQRHHGGDTQAVYAVSRAELDWWAAELGRDLPNGMFGENLTVAGVDVDASHVGDRWLVGGAALVVTAPRIPCATFAARMGEPGWVKRFAARGRSGAYLAVEVGGTLRRGDPIEVVDRPGHGVGVMDVFRAWHGDLAAADLVLDADCLPAAEHEELALRVSRRRGRGA